MNQPHILIIEDFLEDQQALISLIEDEGGEFSFDWAQTGNEAIAAYEAQNHDCVIIDYWLGNETGLDILKRLKMVDPFCAAIIMSGQGSEEIARDAMKSGAVDYLVKGNTTGMTMRATIQRTIERCREDRRACIKHQEQQQFLSTLVHDIRAPFNNISNSTAMLIEDIESGYYEDIGQLVKAQSAAIRHADALIRTLQTYALLDEEVTFERVSLCHVFELLERMFCTDTKAPTPEFEIGPLPDIHGHAPQICQLFQNIVSNALKYNSSIPPRVSVQLVDQNNGFVTICVEDNGLGMDPAETEAIFKPLKRLWSKDEYDGTGLGLSICKKIVKRHHGNIWCESQPDAGSKFFVQLKPAASL